MSVTKIGIIENFSPTKILYIPLVRIAVGTKRDSMLATSPTKPIRSIHRLQACLSTSRLASGEARL